MNPKAWVSEFLFIRELLNGPLAHMPLYSYQVTDDEYTTLRELLRICISNATGTHRLAEDRYFSTCYCLFVSEQYRRNYNRSWSWSGAEAELGTTFNALEHEKLTQSGLGFWKRPIRHRERGRDWLGSLFAEGGLPWPLVQDDSHGFGRAVKRGIKDYFHTEGNRRTTTDLMADFEEYLPLTFRTLETRQLLAGIVDQLMFLVDHYPLKGLEDPASYLDQAVPHWSADFPIPLDKTNARILINDWLRDAGQKREERKEALEKLKEFSCEHILYLHPPSWYIQTELTLPSSATFAIDPDLLGGTRLEVAIYEGESLLDLAGVVYGQLDGLVMNIRFPRQTISLVRRSLSEPVTLRLLESGKMVHRFHFDGSIIDYQDVPLVFSNEGDRWTLRATATCTLSSSNALIRMPRGFSVCSEKPERLIGGDPEEGQWVEISDDADLHWNGETYRIELNQAENEASKATLNGTLAAYDSNPSVIYLGWPRLSFPDGCTFAQEDVAEYANGLPLDDVKRTGYFGLVRYSVRTKAGQTVMQRRFAVLPKDFGLALRPSTNNQPAKIQLKNSESLVCDIECETLKIESIPDKQDKGFYLQHSGNKPPANFILKLGHTKSSGTISIRLPFPFQGARLFDETGQPTGNKELTTSGLLGCRIALTSGFAHGETFNLELELVCSIRPQPRISYDIKVGSSPVLVSLHGLQRDILQLLGAVDEQDSFVRLNVNSPFRLNIRRYNGQIYWESTSILEVSDPGRRKLLDGAKVAAMLLSDPRQEPLLLSEITSEGVGTGRFEVNSAMRKKGPWLIYPDKGSEILFRPSTFNPDSEGIAYSIEVSSLHRAAELFHPTHNPDVIDRQVSEMADSFSHSGWQYFADLKMHYSHLPLSCFESWRALSRNPKAMAFAVLRLEMDEAFCCRVRDELAVIWEAIPLVFWAESYQLFIGQLKELGLPQALICNLEKNRSSILKEVVSGFDYVGDYLHNGNVADLKIINPELVFPAWCNALRQTHDADARWPNELGTVLERWVARQALPESIKSLSPVGYAKAVINLPIFLAFVTAGRATLSDLDVPLPYLKFVIRRVSDFDRQSWFNPVHALMVSYLMASQNSNS